MDDNKILAIELTKSLIQNSNVEPVFNNNYFIDEGKVSLITYQIGDANFSFKDLVSHFIQNLNKINDDY